MPLILYLRLLHSDTGARALVPALGAVVLRDGLLVEELQPGVDIGRTRQLLGDVVQVQLEDREEALQIGLLVDCELYLAGSQQLLGDRDTVVAATHRRAL